MAISVFCSVSLVAGLLTLIWIAKRLFAWLSIISLQLDALRGEVDANGRTIGIDVRVLKRIALKMQPTDPLLSNCDQPDCKPLWDLQYIQTDLHTNN